MASLDEMKAEIVDERRNAKKKKPGKGINFVYFALTDADQNYYPYTPANLLLHSIPLHYLYIWRNPVISNCQSHDAY